jgi:AraC family transcriptional regulator
MKLPFTIRAAAPPVFSAVHELLDDPDHLAAEETALRIAGAALGLDKDGEQAGISPADEARAAAAASLVDEQYAEPLSLRRLADAAGLSPNHFLRVFRRVVGSTPYRYILNRRMSAAAQRLRQGDETVLAVALACGFSDLSEFSRRFRSRFGLSPAAFRRKHWR